MNAFYFLQRFFTARVIRETPRRYTTCERNVLSSVYRYLYIFVVLFITYYTYTILYNRRWRFRLTGCGSRAVYPSHRVSKIYLPITYYRRVQYNSIYDRFTGKLQLYTAMSGNNNNRKISVIISNYHGRRVTVSL